MGKFTDWLFGKSMTPEEFASFEANTERQIAGLQRESTQKHAHHILQMNQQHLDFVQTILKQTLGAVWKILQEMQTEDQTTKKITIDDPEMQAELDTIFADFNSEFSPKNMKYPFIDTYFQGMDNNTLFSSLDSSYKNPELVAQTEMLREQILGAFFQEALATYPEFYRDFVGDDVEIGGKTYWERLSIMRDKRKEERVRQELTRKEAKDTEKNIKAQQEQSELEEKITEGKTEVEIQFEKKKAKILAGERISYHDERISAPYKGLKAREELERYTEEKTRELQSILKTYLLTKFKTEVHEKFGEIQGKIERREQRGFSAPEIRLSVWSLHDLVKEEIGAYMSEKNTELKRLWDSKKK